jgi:rhodanese-related sulfurtransferase
MGRRTIDELLAAARTRMGPHEAAAAMADGALLIDVRSDDQRAADGTVPGAVHFPRNVLEWRCDPDSDARDPRVGGLERRLIVMCDEGYQSSLAAAVLQELGSSAPPTSPGAFRRGVRPACRSIRRPERPVRR